MPDIFINKTKYLFLIWVTMGCMLLLSIHIYLYYPFISDDALISLRYADRLLDGHGLTWTDGIPVEGYSNLLWVLLMAGMGLLGIDLVYAAQFAGVFCVAFPLYICLRAIQIHHDQHTNWEVAALPFMFYVLAAPVAVWAIGGLEQALMVLLLGVSIPGIKRILNSGKVNPIDVCTTLIPLGLLCITRPDGPIFSVVFAGFFLVQQTIKNKFTNISSIVRIFLLILIVPLAFYIGQIGFRLWVYGEWVPNTALVKLKLSMDRVYLGWYYVRTGLWMHLPWILFTSAVVLGVIWRKRYIEPIFVLLVLWMIAWLSYVISIGGDIFPAYRHLVPISVLLLFLGVEGMLVVWGQYKEKGRWLFRTLALILLPCFIFVQWNNAEVQNARTERWEYEGQVLGLVLNKAFINEQPLVAVTSAGCIPFWSKLPSLDMLGLNDYYLPRHRPEDFGLGLIGHELGDGRYIMSQNPDIVIFNTGIPGPAFRSGIEMYAMPEFHEKYASILLYGDEPIKYAFSGYIWVNRYSEKIGIRKMENRIEIPAMFMNFDEGQQVYLDKNNKLARTASVSRPVLMNLGADDYTHWKCQPITFNNVYAECHLYKQDNITILHVSPSSGAQNVTLEKVILSID